MASESPLTESLLTELPERQETDRSLHVERQTTDHELGKRHAAIEASSDAAVDQARQSADDLLDEARERADDSPAAADSTSRQQSALEVERAREDAAIAEERRTADDEVMDERQERIRALASLLRLEREQTDDRLLQERERVDAALAARDDFLGMVSHDLRSLLGGIALSAELQIRTATGDEAGRRTLRTAEKIQRLAARMNRLIGDLMDAASIEAGRLAIAPRGADARAVIHEALEVFKPAASAKGILLRTTDDGPLQARFDHDRVLQVLTNLLSNAIKFTGERGTISVEAVTAGSGVRFSVTDTGAGIAADHLSSVFQRFWQAADGDRRGLGLGLFISKCIVEAHGGRIWVESAIGQGSTFFFELPELAVAGQQPNGALH